MLYLVYILIGMIIIIGVDCGVTAFWALRDVWQNRQQDQLSFGAAFKKYFIKNNNLPTKFSDIFKID